MKNIYDIRKNDKLLYVLPNKAESNNSMVLYKAVVIVNLYYLSTVDRYISYIDRISDEISVYVYSSNQNVLDRVQKLSKKKDLYCNIKPNRGRDISTLLVAAKNVIAQYEYVCFLHDKSSNAEYLDEDVEYWVVNLWENMLSTSIYLENIIKLYESDNSIGILTPPEPYGDYNSHWYGNTWRDNYDMVKNLAQKMGLNASIEQSKEVFTLGTVFWARTKALKKLFDVNWSYEDFQEEPLPIDGTLSHAIERIIGYVAQDAGYKTGTVMTDTYAASLLLKAQEDMRTMFYCLKDREHVQNLHQIRNIDTRDKLIEEFNAKYSKKYIYGAGNYGRIMCDILLDKNIDFEGFVVSTGNRSVNVIANKPVYEIQELSPNSDVGMFIAVSYELKSEIEILLKEQGFVNNTYVF